LPHPAVFTPSPDDKLIEERARAWYRQCSPHIKQRAAAVHVNELLSLISRLRAELEGKAR
jgi:translation initiation factor 2 beta subunit (eIF-2beta)/eIF-5